MKPRHDDHRVVPSRRGAHDAGFVSRWSEEVLEGLASPQPHYFSLARLRTVDPESYAELHGYNYFSAVRDHHPDVLGEVPPVGAVLKGVFLVSGIERLRNDDLAKIDRRPPRDADDVDWWRRGFRHLERLRRRYLDVLRRIRVLRLRAGRVDFHVVGPPGDRRVWFGEWGGNPWNGES